MFVVLSFSQGSDTFQEKIIEEAIAYQIVLMSKVSQTLPSDTVKKRSAAQDFFTLLLYFQFFSSKSLSISKSICEKSFIYK